MLWVCIFITLPIKQYNQLRDFFLLRTAKYFRMILSGGPTSENNSAKCKYWKLP